ncbi:carbohydrate ABC transporter permease [Natronosalvus caseinilyticus]|uniref:carbohydrate ABC transporter permease n=1 Tax=Natronosalvus caseinilyticus TaxID=2953747 RepID=UPI0028AEDBD7|nr:carbohydrate ABC transporter permease [Natronosalvus caseinilyticus]
MASKQIEGNRLLDYSTRKRIWEVLEGPAVVHLVVAMGLVMVLTPIVWTVLTSIQTDHGARQVAYLPQEVTFTTLYNVLVTEQFYLAIYNTLIIASVTTIITVGLGTPAGYVFSRYRFPFDTYVFIAVIAARLFPPIGLLIPYFQIIDSMGLLNTKMGIIFANVYLWLPLVIYMMRNFFMSIPKAIDESARVDGCTKFQSFRKVIFPLALPGFAASAILTFLFSWREFLFAFMVSADRSSMPVSVGAYRFIGDQTTLWASLSAASVLAMLPTVLIIIFFHRYIVSGLTSGAVKG